MIINFLLFASQLKFNWIKCATVFWDLKIYSHRLYPRIVNLIVNRNGEGSIYLTFVSIVAKLNFLIHHCSVKSLNEMLVKARQFIFECNLNFYAKSWGNQTALKKKNEERQTRKWKIQIIGQPKYQIELLKAIKHV